MFVANISHELRTPLALILGLTEKVLKSDDCRHLQHENSKSLETVIDNANILLKVSLQPKLSFNSFALRFQRISIFLALIEAYFC
jgi:signal transduction histidine kinase